MTHRLTAQETVRLIRSINIPSKPAILIQLAAEMADPTVDVHRLGDLIAQDLGLAAAVLRTVNSPLFGLRGKVGSIHQAVAILGTRNITQIVTCQALRRALPETPVLPEFWDEAERVAGVTAFVARSCPRKANDEAYSFGMLQDVGMLVLSRMYADYDETLQEAHTQTDVALTEVEERRYAMSHALVGHLVARVWGLPKTLCDGILHHHDLTGYQQEADATPESLRLVALAIVAQRMARAADDAWPEGEEACAVLELPPERIGELGSELAAMA